MADAIKNFGKVTVSTGYDASATSIALSSGEGARLPDPATDGQFNLVWWNTTDYADPSDDPNREIVRVTARSTDTLTVIRGFEGTTASTKNTASKTYKMILAITDKTASEYASNEGDNIIIPKRTVLGSTKQAAAVVSGGRTRITLDANGRIRIGYDFSNVSKNLAIGSAFDTTTQTSDGRGGIAFKPDGTKMYVQAGQVVYQYTLSTPWDVSTATYDSVSSGSLGYNLRGIRFRPDGKKVYMVNDSADQVNQYGLSTAWDISTLSYESNTSVSSQTTSPYGLEISGDGRFFYVAHDGVGGDGLYQYGLKVPWDMSTGYYIQFLSVSSNNPEGIMFNPSGTKLYVLSDFAPEGLMEFTLTTPWDVSTASFVQTYTLPGNLQDDIFMTPQGDAFFLYEVSGGTVQKYEMLNGGFFEVDSASAVFGVRDGTNNRYATIDATNGLMALTDIVEISRNGGVLTFGTVSNHSVYLKQNNAIRIELTASGINIYSPRTIYTSGGEMWFGLTDSNPLKINTNNTERMRINGDGTIMVGANTSTGLALMNLQSSSRTAYTGLSSPANYFQYNWHNVNTNDVGIGIGFAVTTDNTNVGAAIIHRRTSSNSQGRLEFYTKNSTTAAVAPVLAITIDQSQNVKFGSTAGTAVMRVHIVGTDATTAGLMIDRYSDNAFGAGIRQRKARGTEASPTQVLANDVLANYGGIGYHSGGAFAGSPSGYIAIIATENHTSSAQGTYLAFYNVKAGGTTVTYTFGLGSHIYFGQRGAGDLRAQSNEVTMHRRAVASTGGNDIAEHLIQRAVQTTDATVTVIYSHAGGQNDQVLHIRAVITGRRTGGTGGTAGDVASYEIIGTFKDISGTKTQIGTTTVVHTAEDQAGWDANFNVNAGNIEVRVQGAADNTIKWHASIYTQEHGT